MKVWSGLLGLGLAGSVMLGTLGGALAADKGASSKPATTTKAASKSSGTKTAAMYECKACHTTSAKAGNCPKCGKAMTKMASTKGHKKGGSKPPM